MNHSKISSRFFAMLVDSIIITALNTGIRVACVKLIPGLGELLAFLLSLLIFQFYIIRPIQKTGQTLGKKLLGIQIVFETIEPSAWTIIKREFIGKFLSLLPLYLGFFWAIIDPKKRTFHDMIAMSEVVTLESEEEHDGGTPWLKWLPLIGMPALSLTISFVFLFTSAPLNALHTQLEGAGLKMDSLSGSIIGGIEATNLSGDFDGGSLQFKTITFKIDFLESILNKKFLISHATAEHGFVNKKSLEVGLPSFSQPEPHGDPNANIKQDKNIKNLAVGIGLLRLKDVTFKENNNTVLPLHLLEIKSLELAQKKISFEQIQFNTAKINLSLEEADFEPEKGRVALNRINGHLTPALSKVIKKQINFALQTASPQGAKIKLVGDIAGAKVVGVWGNQKKHLDIKNLNVAEFLTVDLPIENFNLNLNLENNKMPSYESTLSICKKTFRLQGPFYVHVGKGKTFRIFPSPPAASTASTASVVSPATPTSSASLAPPNTANIPVAPKTPETEVAASGANPAMTPAGSTVIAQSAGPLGLSFNENKTASDYLPLTLAPDISNGPYLSVTEAASDLCYSKKSDELFPDERTLVNSIAKSVKLPDPAMQPQLTKTLANPEEMAKNFQLVYDQSKNLFKQGKPKEALDILNNVTPPASLTKEQQIAYLRYISWLHLLYGDSKKSAMLFTILYGETQNISDAEGAMRSYEKRLDLQNKNKWALLIKSKIANNPELKAKLSGNFRRSIASEN